ncbi:MAG: RHS repeat protein [Actinobacteria bacterium]|nr:RHS repeat protein [Actinomycetota bacterium]
MASTWGFAFDPVSGLPTGIVDPSGGVTSLRYSLPSSNSPCSGAQQCWLAQVTDPLGRQSTYSNFDVFGDPQSVQAPDGVVTTKTYDAHGNVTSSSTPWQNAGGGSLGSAAVTVWHRDPTNPDEVSELDTPDGRKQTFTYDPVSHQVVSMTDADGTTTYYYDAAGHRVATVSPAGNVSGADKVQHRSVSALNAAGESVLGVAANSGGVADGFVRNTSSGLGAAATGEAWSGGSGWSVSGGVASAGAAGTAVLASEVTPAAGELVASVVPSGVAGPVGVVFRVSDASNYWAASVSTSGGLTVTKVVGGVATTVTSVPSAGFTAGDVLEVLATGAGNMLVWRNGNLVWGGTDTSGSTGPGAGLFAGVGGPVSAGFAIGTLGGGVTAAQFDPDGRRVATSGPRTNGWNLASTGRSFDVSGNNVSSTDEKGQVSVNTFNMMDERVLQQNPVQVAAGSTVGTVYAYDVLGRVVSTQSPGESATTVQYSNGDLTTSSPTPATKVVTEPSGSVVTTTYDADSEPVSVTFGGTVTSPPTPSQSFTYDADGRVIEADAGTVTTSRSYDSVGDVLSVTRAGSTVSYGLVAPGKIGTIRYPNNQVVTRGYDASGRWDSVTDWTGLAQATTTFGFDDDGNVNQVNLGNGTAVSVVFDADGNPSSATYKFTGGSWPVTYSRGPAGELTGVSQWGGSSAYTYDPVQQLTGSTNPATTTGFDAAGEPTTVGGNTQAFTVAGRLCWSGSTTGSCSNPPSGATVYGFDGNGDRTSAGSNSYGFDANAMMTTATTPAGSSSYAYSADGLRTSKTVAGVTTAFAYDDVSGSTPELIGDGNGFYLYGPNGLPFEYLPNGSGATPEWLFCDAATGSVGSVTDTTGTIIATHAYDPWGTPPPRPAHRFRWDGTPNTKTPKHISTTCGTATTTRPPHNSPPPTPCIRSQDHGMGTRTTTPSTAPTRLGCSDGPASPTR